MSRQATASRTSVHVAVLGHIERGHALARPGSIKPRRAFKAQRFALSKAGGGRHAPFFTNDCPRFYFRTPEVTAWRSHRTARVVPVRTRS
ncbi:hypothetical protein [Corallococcus sp. RDP092CA]|uniref:EF-Tu C-terminal domain-related protein n=1 Tax=Corallococcus sp. RDP092CA TaxID=3109369 RepID=UPI0035B4CB61